MIKPHGRKTKQKVGKILSEHSRETALKILAQIPDEQLVGHLFSHFYHKDELIKFRSIAAMGDLGSRVGQKNMEKARIILRRIMWNRNDESGGIGWGSPEAMVEILGQSPELALEFKSILFSYLDPRGNYLEHEMLQRGVLWGIGTYLKANPGDLYKGTKSLLSGCLNSLDPVKRGYAVRALINAQCFDRSLIPENIMADTYGIDLFNGWDFITTRISDLALSC
ncbi:DVU0298 family protein [Desulfobacula sp.]